MPHSGGGVPPRGKNMPNMPAARVVGPVTMLCLGKGCPAGVCPRASFLRRLSGEDTLKESPPTFANPQGRRQVFPIDGGPAPRWPDGTEFSLTAGGRCSSRWSFHVAAVLTSFHHGHCQHCHFRTGTAAPRNGPSGTSDGALLSNRCIRGDHAVHGTARIVTPVQFRQVARA